MTVPPPPEPPEDSDNSAASADPFGISPSSEGMGSGSADVFDDPGLDQGKPEVAASKSRILAVMGSLGVLVLFLLYNIFSTPEAEVPEGPKKIEVAEAPPEAPLTPPPALPDVGPTAPAPVAPPPDLVPPPVPAPVVPTPMQDTLPIVDPAKENAAAAQLAERQRSSIFASGGSGGGLLGSTPSTPTTQQNNFFGSDPNASFANAATATEAKKSVASRIPNLRQTIAQGRIIQATLETAISTDLPAQIRAIVARDVYGEAGTAVLIPKGSRLIGAYNTSILPGQNRVFIVWQRLIRPDGIDIMVNSSGVDNLGFAGLDGFLDTKFREVFSRAVLASVISIGLAIGADSAGVGQTSQTSSIFGQGQSAQTQQGDAAALATNQALQNLGNVSQQFLTNFVNVRPTILVDQGTPVNVMLNRDLVFPSEVAGGSVIH